MNVLYGCRGWHFDAVGVSSFTHLSKFTLRAEDDDGFADISELRLVLDSNASTLTHLTLGAYLQRAHSWDSAFHSSTINNLTRLDLVDTRISHFVLSRVVRVEGLRELTLHGVLERAEAAGVVFGSDCVIEGGHTILPRLEAFRFILVGGHAGVGGEAEDATAVYRAVVSLLKGRKGLRRLDLGACPWEMMQGLLREGELCGLRVLRVRIPCLQRGVVEGLVGWLPREMRAVHLSTAGWEKPLVRPFSLSPIPILLPQPTLTLIEYDVQHEYATPFRPFPQLSMLHLSSSPSPSSSHNLSMSTSNPISRKRPNPSLMSEKEYQVQMDIWNSGARRIAMAVPALDFVGWHGEHYVVVRSSSPSSLLGGGREGAGGGRDGGGVELKELPARRRLDCGKGVDLGTEDAMWMERKDVPIDYEMSGLDVCG